MRSMTGFGLAHAQLGEGRLQVEARSVNHRYLDVRVRLPSDLADHSFFLEQLARQKLSRGRYDIGVRVEGPALPAVRFSTEKARDLYAELCKLRDELAPGTPVPISVVTSMPEVLEPSAVAQESVRESLRQALEGALESLDQMRAREGETLRGELSSRLSEAQRLRQSIQARVPVVLDQQRARLSERLSKLLTDSKVQLDEGRLEHELALLADKSDVTEELLRLESHFTQFVMLLGSEGPIGRQLDFLLQEVGREANTIGSKSSDAETSHLVVALKSEVERIREQVQNVE